MRVLLLFLLIVISYGRTYSIPYSEINYTINSDGIIHVTEKITYDLNGCYNELYITKPKDIILKNPRGYCIPNICTFNYKTSPNYELILRLKEGKNCDKVVIAVFEYDVIALEKKIKTTFNFITRSGARIGKNQLI